jgi:hypothetical protein
VDRRAPKSTRYGNIDQANHGVGVIWAPVQLAKEHMACIYMFRMTANDFRRECIWVLSIGDNVNPFCTTNEANYYEF